jgi:hypothetical protein
MVLAGYGMLKVTLIARGTHALRRRHSDRCLGETGPGRRPRVQKTILVANLAAARGWKGSETGKKVDLPGIDIVSLARGYGCDAARLDDIAAIKKAATEAWGEQRPTVPEIPASAQVPPLI